MAGRPLRVLALGRRPYGEVEALQEALRGRVLAGEHDAEALILVEHDAVVTIGRRGDEAGLRVTPEALAARGIALVRASRGGEATYHGPGQLVVYPILLLERGVVAHVEALASAACALAARLGVEARYERARPGVWVGEKKLASIGVHVHRRVAIHGLALNVDRRSLEGFSAIVPCGMPDVELTCLEDAAGRALDVSKVGAAYAQCLADAISRPLAESVSDARDAA